MHYGDAQPPQIFPGVHFFLPGVKRFGRLLVLLAILQKRPSRRRERASAFNRKD